MRPHSLKSGLRALLIGTMLSGAAIVAPAAAETVEVMVLNIRSEDGVFRPALRVIRGGTVTFFPAGDAASGLTVAILRDQAQLQQWLGNTFPAQAGGDPITFTITEVRTSKPKIEEEPEAEEEPVEEEPPVKEEEPPVEEEEPPVEEEEPPVEEEQPPVEEEEQPVEEERPPVEENTCNPDTEKCYIEPPPFIPPPMPPMPCDFSSSENDMICDY